jgi:hypothetical protein
MNHASTILMTGILLTTPSLMLGCSDDKQAAVEVKKDSIQTLNSELASAKQASTPETRLLHLRNYYDQAVALDGNWPDSEEAQELRRTFESQRASIPRTVMRLALRIRDLDSFQWAVERASEEDIVYDDIMQTWEMGKSWRDSMINAHPEQTLSIFMFKSMNEYSVRFFNQHLPTFASLGYKAVYPLQQTEFNTEFCTFYASELKDALKKKDVERIRFLLEYMPSSNVMDFNDDTRMNETMEALGTYVIEELKDEALACQLIELGYAMPQLDIDSLPLGESFYRALLRDPESAITQTLKLNEWHGPLSQDEREFIYNLSDEHLRLVHPIHLTEAIGAAIKVNNTEQAMRLIPVREEVQKMDAHEYDRILGWALIYEDKTVTAYVQPKCRQVNIYRLDLDELGSNWPMFRRLHPRIFKRIYPTMDSTPKKDGTSLGRIDVLLKSHNPEAVEYVIKRNNFEAAWTKTEGTGRTLLMAVCEGGNLEAAKYLIEDKKADVRAHTDYAATKKTVFGEGYSKEGKLTALSFASQGGHSETVRYLISKGAAVNAGTYYGVTPLMYAVAGNHLETAKCLLKDGADVNAALMMNPLRSDNHGDVNRLNIKVGDTAYSMARDRGNTALINLLKESGATLK